jgi:hypothetical protein
MEIFQEQKRLNMKTHVLILSDFSKDFQVCTNASGEGIGGVII